MNVYSITSAITNGLVNGLIILFNIITAGILSSVHSVLSGFGLMIKNPLNTWAKDIAKNQNALSIPIIFTVIFGVSIFIILFLVDIFGLEKDVEEGIGGLMDI